MPITQDDGTFVYGSLRHATYYAKGAGFEITKTGDRFIAKRDDVLFDYELVEVEGPYLNYSWVRIEPRPVNRPRNGNRKRR